MVEDVTNDHVWQDACSDTACGAAVALANCCAIGNYVNEPSSI